MAVKLRTNVIRFPAKFLLSKLPSDHQAYTMLDGWQMDAAALAVAVLGQQRETTAVDRLTTLLDCSALTHFVQVAMVRISTEQSLGRLVTSLRASEFIDLVEAHGGAATISVLRNMAEDPKRRKHRDVLALTLQVLEAKILDAGDTP